MKTKRDIALITGGSRGIGKNIAIKLAEKGFDIIITYRKEIMEAEKVVEEIEHIGGKAIAIKLSQERLDSFNSFFCQLRQILLDEFHTDHFNYLINNAGIGLSTPFCDTTEEQFDLLMNTLFKGVYFFTQKALQYLNDNGGIINISSRLAQASVPGYSAYASMKSAIEALTRYEAKELSIRGIRVNSIAPGPIATDFADGVIRDDAEYNAKLKAMTPFGRIGVPDDIGGVVAFLCTKEAAWLNGQRIEISGGMNL